MHPKPPLFVRQLKEETGFLKLDVALKDCLDHDVEILCLDLKNSILEDRVFSVDG